MSKNLLSRRRLVALAALSCAPVLHAADALPPVVVTGNPLRSTQADAWAQRLSGDALAARRTGTLGATLDGLPGVSASAFGPHASRPVLRGLDGDRLRILSNGGSAFDAASLSPDHAVALDPLVVEAIEWVRGPAALLYGGNALGGVVNALDNRVPKGSRGAAFETRLGGAGQERQAAAVLDGGPADGAGLAWHADLSQRRSEAQRSPRFEYEGETYQRLRNSDGEQRAAALGVGWVGPQGFAGFSVDDFDAEYGVTAEPDVRIRMQRQRLGHEGEWRSDSGLWRTLRWQAARTRYGHDELEGDGQAGTQFRLRGSDARLELEHQPLGPLRGVLGLQWEAQRFSALGDEAFVPSTRTAQKALFLMESWQQGAWSWSAGARTERVRQHSEGDGDSLEARFGPAQTRRFTPRNLALQAAWQASASWRVQAQLTHAERAPTHYELFANGRHAATAAFERGDASLNTEQAQGQELALVHAAGGLRLQLNLHRQRFARFIALEGTGERVEDEGEDFPVQAFQSVPARLQGFELQASQRWQTDGSTWTLSASLDQTRGVNRATGAPLPRLAPQRLQLGLQWRHGAWAASLDGRHVARQTRFGADDGPTPGYRWWDLGLGYAFTLGGHAVQVALKGQNLGNALAYNAVTVATLRGLAPLPGRNWQLRVGLAL